MKYSFLRHIFWQIQSQQKEGAIQQESSSSQKRNFHLKRRTSWNLAWQTNTLPRGPALKESRAVYMITSPSLPHMLCSACDYAPYALGVKKQSTEVDTRQWQRAMRRKYNTSINMQPDKRWEQEKLSELKGNLFCFFFSGSFSTSINTFVRKILVKTRVLQ